MGVITEVNVWMSQQASLGSRASSSSLLAVFDLSYNILKNVLFSFHTYFYVASYLLSSVGSKWIINHKTN